ncbi:MAG TPA: 5-formyltetrahydrofolate cyclo-ligase, partial [Nitrososphaeraceae archaeon]
MMKLDNQGQKSILRKEILRKRNSLSQFQIVSISKLIQKNLIKSPEFIESKSIGIYLPIGSEVRTDDIISIALESKKTLLLPRVITNDLQFYIVEKKDFDEDSFDINKFGVREPKETNGKLDFIDLLIIPGIAFDYYGYRIGYGHGYYDKYMTNGKFSKSIGLAYDLQVIKSPIPKFEYDKKIDILFT